jgi:hypothetical protein
VERDELPSVPRHPPSVPRHPSSVISYTTFDGIELTARKRFSQKWMMAANYSYNTGKQSAPVPTRDYLDPTNHDTTEGKATSVTPWTAKISALCSLPWQMSISGLADIRSGKPYNTIVRSPTRPNGLSTVDVNLQDANSLLYPTFSQLDIRFDKAIRFGGSRSLTLAATVHNVFNSNTTLAIVTRQNTSTANNITTILAPRVAQVGAKVAF